jgi:CDP-diacylglycerol--glycerol-3-phosphate 3-phosphatidyltransferase
LSGKRARFYLNEIADVVSDAALYAPFALVAAPFGAFGVGLVIVLSLLTEFAGSLRRRCRNCAALRRSDGKSDRAVVFGLLGLWVAIAGSLPELIRWLISRPRHPCLCSRP